MESLSKDYSCEVSDDNNNSFTLSQLLRWATEMQAPNQEMIGLPTYQEIGNQTF